MNIKIALAGNPNCGKTTLFNALTLRIQYSKIVLRWSKLLQGRSSIPFHGFFPILLHSCSFFIKSAQIVLSRSTLLLGRRKKQFKCFSQVFFNPSTLRIQHAKLKLSRSILLLRSF